MVSETVNGILDNFIVEKKETKKFFMISTEKSKKSKVKKFSIPSLIVSPTTNNIRNKSLAVRIVYIGLQ